MTAEEVRKSKNREAGRKYYRANKEKIKAAAQEYKKANPEKVKEYQRKYGEANKEKDKERWRKYHEANAETRRDYQRKYREANPEKVSERQRKYREANPEKLKERDRKYRETNQEKRRGYNRRRRARLSGVENTLTEAEYQQILKDHNYRCHYGEHHTGKLTQDHKIPISKGGGHTKENIVPACARCNSEKGTREYKEFITMIRSRGRLIRGSA